MVVVTGATENTGSALVTELQTSGAGPLRGLTRDPARATFPEGGEAVAGDLTRTTAGQQVETIAALLGREVPFTEISRQEAHREMAGFLGDEAADAVLDLTGGDVTDELLMVRDTVFRITGSPARTFHQWATENAAAFH
ncbi:hypothetical protein AAGT00_01590 [Streptomyces cavourensis]|uniref:hypothetical protein n=1 Tax=Streptomyces bacillaris TaxID=68179 RepID=UPI00369A89DC